MQLKSDQHESIYEQQVSQMELQTLLQSHNYLIHFTRNYFQLRARQVRKELDVFQEIESTCRTNFRSIMYILTKNLALTNIPKGSSFKIFSSTFQYIYNCQISNLTISTNT